MRTKSTVQVSLTRNKKIARVLLKKINALEDPIDKKIKELEKKKTRLTSDLMKRYRRVDDRIDNYEEELNYWDENVLRRKWQRKVPKTPEEFNEYILATKNPSYKPIVVNRVTKLPNGIIIFTTTFYNYKKYYGAWQGRKKVGSLTVEMPDNAADHMYVKGEVLGKEVEFDEGRTHLYGKTVIKPLGTWKKKLSSLKSK